MKKRSAALVTALTAVLAACAGPASSTATVDVGGTEFRVDVARTEQSQRDGLSGRRCGRVVGE